MPCCETPDLDTDDRSFTPVTYSALLRDGGIPVPHDGLGTWISGHDTVRFDGKCEKTGMMGLKIDVWGRFVSIRPVCADKEMNSFPKETTVANSLLRWADMTNRQECAAHGQITNGFR